MLRYAFTRICTLRDLHSQGFAFTRISIHRDMHSQGFACTGICSHRDLHLQDSAPTESMSARDAPGDPKVSQARPDFFVIPSAIHFLHTSNAFSTKMHLLTSSWVPQTHEILNFTRNIKLFSHPELLQFRTFLDTQHEALKTSNCTRRLFL